MRKLNCKNKTPKYLVEVDNEIIECCSYAEIIQHLDNCSIEDVRNYFRFYKDKDLKTKKTKNKFGGINITKVKKVNLSL